MTTVPSTPTDPSGYGSATPVNGGGSYLNPLPSVQLRYYIDQNSDLRAVFGMGISRPDPYDLVPYKTLDETKQPNVENIGNPAPVAEHADDMVYDDAHHMLYVGHGGSSAAAPGKVAAVDTASFTLLANLSVAAHPEALDLDAPGRRIFANIADAGEVAVIDGATNSVVAHWKLANATDNVPMAYNSGRHILYVACRTPATLLALDGAAGAELSRATTGEGADDLFYDASLSRVYVISGAGEVDAFDVSGTAIKAIGVTRTAPGAKTALFVPSESALYVGVPATGGKPAEIRVHSTAIQKESK